MSRLQTNHNNAQMLPLSGVPCHDETYAFATLYADSERLQEKIDILLTERSRIENLLISNSEFLSRLKTSHATLTLRLLDRLQLYLADETFRHQSVTDPLMRFETRFARRDESSFLPAWQDISSCVKNIPDVGISDGDREKQLAVIDSKIVELQKKMPTISSEDRSFVKFWQEIQSQLCEPSGPRALALAASSDQEKSAWERLGLEVFINLGGSLKPSAAD
jgi:hypothetical protein